MTAADGDDRDRQSPVDAAYVANLDALDRDLCDIEAVAAAALAGDPTNKRREAPCGVSDGLAYAALTERNRERRDVETWGEVELAGLFDPVALEQLDQWREGQRLPWDQ